MKSPLTTLLRNNTKSWPCWFSCFLAALCSPWSSGRQIWRCSRPHNECSRLCMGAPGLTLLRCRFSYVKWRNACTEQSAQTYSKRLCQKPTWAESGPKAKSKKHTWGKLSRASATSKAASHPSGQRAESIWALKNLLSAWRATQQLATSPQLSRQPVIQPTKHPACWLSSQPATSHPANHSADQPACQQAQTQSCQVCAAFVVFSGAYRRFVFS